MHLRQGRGRCQDKQGGQGKKYGSHGRDDLLLPRIYLQDKHSEGHLQSTFDLHPEGAFIRLAVSPIGELKG